MNKQVIFSGGIGNQMFEYAFLLFLSKKGVKASINTNMYQYMKMHSGYVLDKVFDIKHEPFLGDTRIASFIVYALAKIHPRFLVCNEGHLGNYDIKKIWSSKKPFFNGCWIDPIFFKGIQNEIREAFRFRHIDENNIELGVYMQGINSVSLHIRRGDYLKLPQYAICDEAYYTNAIAYMLKQIDNPVFYIFSDDPDWCRDFMEKTEVCYKILDDNQGADAYKDMYLMTCCRHNIIANSTFSWWGAWLNNNDNKIVVCPRVWIKGEEFNPCPNNWIYI